MSSTIDRDYSVDMQQGWQEQMWSKKANKLKAKHLNISSPTPLWGTNEAHFKIDQKKTNETALRTLQQEYVMVLEELEVTKNELSSYKTNAVKRLNQELRLSEELDVVTKKNTKINNLIASFKTTLGELQEKITLKTTEMNSTGVDVEQVEKELSSLDEKFENLKETYLTLNIKIENAIKLTEETIKKCTFSQVAEKQQTEMKIQFAAKIGLSLEAVNQYEAEFEESLKNCQETFKNTKEAFNAAGEFLVAVNASLNAMDHQIGMLKNPTRWNILGSHWGQKWRTFQAGKV